MQYICNKPNEQTDKQTDKQTDEQTDEQNTRNYESLFSHRDKHRAAKDNNAYNERKIESLEKQIKDTENQIANEKDENRIDQLKIYRDYLQQRLNDLLT